MKRKFTQLINEYRYNIEAELKDKTEGFIFSAIGEIKKNGSFICGGQCLDEIKNEITNPEMLEIINFWEKYHLNDMNADCKHGINELLAEKELKINKYSLKTPLFADQKKLKTKIIEQCKLGKVFKLSEEEVRLLNLELGFEGEFCPEELTDFYDIKETKTEFAGWVKKSELTPNGVLCRPCPTCGYEYGTKWNFRKIPDEDLERIKFLLKG